MSRYIDAEKLKDDLVELMTTKGVSAVLVYGLIDGAPTADVIEVKHGYWKWDEKHKEYYCPICQHHKDTEKADFMPPYCNICGAKMDEEVE